MAEQQVNNKYQRGKIYKIVSNETNQIYIGSTIKQYLSSRLQEHKTKYKQYLEGRYHYVTSFDILQYDDHRIVLLEAYPCASREELVSREDDYLVHYKDTIVNKQRAQRDQKQYYEDNKETLIEKARNYYENNRDKLYEKCVCECGSEYAHRSKTRHFKTKKHMQFLEQ